MGAMVECCWCLSSPRNLKLFGESAELATPHQLQG
jgi:hypothetical protein